MYTLYWRENTGAFVVDLGLSLAGAPVTRVHVDTKSGRNREPAYLALNPLGQIPTLRLPSGEVMTESAAMVVHLAELFPNARLAPPPGDPARPRFLRWLMVLATSVYDVELRVSYPARYTADPDGADGVLRAAKARQDELFAIVARELEGRPFMLGAGATLLDGYLAMLAKWYGGETGRERLLAHRAALRADPTTDAVWRRHFPDTA